MGQPDVSSWNGEDFAKPNRGWVQWVCCKIRNGTRNLATVPGPLQDNQPGAFPDSRSTVRTEFCKWDQNGGEEKQWRQRKESVPINVKRGQETHRTHTLGHYIKTTEKALWNQKLYWTTSPCKSPEKLISHRNENGQILRSNLKVILKRISRKLSFLKTMEAFQKDMAIKKIKIKDYSFGIS